MDKSESNLSLSIQSKTWLKDTEDLFDFEAKDIHKESFTLKESNKIGFLLSQDDLVILKPSLDEIASVIQSSANIKVLSEILYKKNNLFQIINPIYSKNLRHLRRVNMDRFWEILPKGKTQEIRENDIIKLGRVRLKFSSIVINKSNTGLLHHNNTNIIVINTLGNQNNISDNININNTITNINNSFNKGTDQANRLNEVQKSNDNSEKHAKEPKYYCRICYTAESDINNPLVSPCKCTGSMGYIHFACLKNCVESKIQKKKEEYYVSYMWKTFNCEICLEEYPKYLKYKTKTYNVVDIDTQYSQYAICDYSLFDDTKKKTINKGVIVIKIEDDKELTVGRTQTNHVKLKDISVSRVHCSFIKESDKFFLHDKGSKFGTLFYLKEPYNIFLNKNETKKSADFVSGKHCFAFTLMSSCSFFGNLFSLDCCRCKSINDEEFIINLDTEKKECKLKDGFDPLTNTFDINANNNDSYHDLILNLSSIIIEEEEDEEEKKEETSVNFNN